MVEEQRVIIITWENQRINMLVEIMVDLQLVTIRP